MPPDPLNSLRSQPTTKTKWLSRACRLAFGIISIKSQAESSMMRRRTCWASTTSNREHEKKTIQAWRSLLILFLSEPTLPKSRTEARNGLQTEARNNRQDISHKFTHIYSGLLFGRKRASAIPNASDNPILSKPGFGTPVIFTSAFFFAVPWLSYCCPRLPQLRSKINRSPTITKLPPGTWSWKRHPASTPCPFKSIVFLPSDPQLPRTAPKRPINSLHSQPTTKPCLSAGFRKNWMSYSVILGDPSTSY